MSGYLFFNREEPEDAADFVGRTFIRPPTTEDAEAFFSLAEGAFDFIGATDAAENLRRYRSGTGERRNFSDEEMDRYPAFGRAEDINRTRFESRTFTGRTGEEDRINRPLRSLEDGQSFEFEDHWDQSINRLQFNGLSNPARDTVLDLSLPNYLALGRTGAQSQGRFRATRRGADVEITGTVEHGMRRNPEDAESGELFDFNPGQIGSPQATILEGKGQAEPFAMSDSRIQDVVAKLRRSDDGSLTLREVVWGRLR